MTYEEKTISTERIYEGKILNLRRDKVSVIGDETSYREIVEHSGGVGVAAIKDDGRMLMVKQFRKPAEQVVLEIPAGKKEEGEDPQLTALRELKEETGYTAEKIEYLTEFYSSIGYSTEIIYLYMATGLTAGETEFDEYEAIDLCEYDVKDLKEMVLSGEIKDGKTIAAILIAAAKLDI